ncbi:Dehydrogenase/reductase SDR family member 1 [Aphelenchoides besseyi]|nr:Dehydrogenase/reductase SDR family member 1 [Aphelenchoides besseyi]KAI6202458.1 Dehydrogenase/reductase SDR family member 1 [Aphelenchoides besseyi]
MSLKGQVALVTGASRGCGRGIALALGSAGMTVYVTSLRSEEEDEVVKSVQHKLPTLESVADEITKRGGKGIAVFCDHSNSKQVDELFKRITEEQNGQLDILVNNAFAAVTKMLKIMHTKFYELPEDIYDLVTGVGLKGHYICARHAAKLMVPRRRGLIVTTSSFGGASYIFNVAYGIGKVGCDRMAADIAIELKEFGITSDMKILSAAHVKEHYKYAESVEYAGRCIVAIANDPNRMEKTGKILLVQKLGEEYDVKEDDGSRAFHPGVSKYVDFIDQINKFRSEIIM